ncbi:MAG: MlaD family protein [bacterium]
MSKNPDKQDHGVVADSRKRGVAWVWIFPILAAAATAWFLWTDYQSMGPEIQIIFDEVPGIQAGKTPLLYRGVDAGMVTAVQLDESLNKVVVKVRLKKFATGLASTETKFWVEKPVITLAELTGLESIIQGNSIRAGNPGGAPATRFTGLPNPPLMPLLPGAFTVRLRGAEIPFLNRGTPVYYRGVKVGLVREKIIDEAGVPELRLMIEEAYRNTLRTTSRFWRIPATSVVAGQHGVKLDVEGVEALVQGALAFDHFDREGMEISNDALLELSSSEFAARSAGRHLKVSFDNVRGILPGETKVCYLGQPIGLVESLQPNPSSSLVLASIRLMPEFDHLADTASSFTLVRPRISLDGISGLDTILSGVYIEFSPGSGGVHTDLFAGRSVSKEEWDRLQNEQQGLPFTLSAENLPPLAKGAPVLHRGVVVGSILEKTFDKNQKPVLRGVVRPEFRNVLDADARFWRVPATSIKAGPGFLQFDVNGLKGLIQGAVAFDVFTARSKTAGPDSHFTLYENEANARALSAPIKIRFINGRGLAVGQTELRYLGVPVGLVEAVETAEGRVVVTARLNQGYEFLRREDSFFSIVRPNISLQGITGLETLISGVYIECTPGSSKRLADTFTGRSTIDAEEILQSGLTLNLYSDATPINAGASVYYRGISVGRVTAKSLSSDGRQILLTVVVEKKYRHLVRQNSKFWDSSGLKASLGFLQFRIQTESIMAPDGRIAFATPENSAMGSAATNGDSFELSHSPRPEWLKWNPSIPVGE